MAVTTASDFERYGGDGSTVTFPFPHYFEDDNDITVIVYTSGDASIKTLNADYTISGTKDPDLDAYISGANVVFTTAPASGTTVLIVRDTSDDQPTSYTELGSFPAKSHEAALDHLALLAQELDAKSIEFVSGLPDTGLPGQFVLELTTKTLYQRSLVGSSWILRSTLGGYDLPYFGIGTTSVIGGPVNQLVATGTVPAIDPKFTVLSLVNANAWGAVGDNSTDNWNVGGLGLKAMRDFMLADKTKFYIIYFGPGTYRYSVN